MKVGFFHALRQKQKMYDIIQKKVQRGLVYERDSPACGGGEVDRTADDEGVRLRQLGGNLVYHIIKHALARLSAFAASDTATDVLVAHMEQLDLNTLGL